MVFSYSISFMLRINTSSVRISTAVYYNFLAILQCCFDSVAVLQNLFTMNYKFYSRENEDHFFHLMRNDPLMTTSFKSCWLFWKKMVYFCMETCKASMIVKCLSGSFYYIFLWFVFRMRTILFTLLLSSPSYVCKISKGIYLVLQNMAWRNSLRPESKSLIWVRSNSDYTQKKYNFIWENSWKTRLTRKYSCVQTSNLPAA